MIKAGLIALIVALMAASSAEAGGRYGYGQGYYGGHYRGGYGRPYGRYYYGGRYYRGGYGRNYGYGYRGYNNDYDGYLAGLLVGGLFLNAFSPPAVATERVVVYRRPVQRAPVAVETVSRPVYRPVPAEPPPYYYRKDPNGACWLIERAEDGSEAITPEDPRTCG